MHQKEGEKCKDTFKSESCRAILSKDGLSVGFLKQHFSNKLFSSTGRFSGHLSLATLQKPMCCYLPAKLQALLKNENFMFFLPGRDSLKYLIVAEAFIRFHSC